MHVSYFKIRETCAIEGSGSSPTLLSQFIVYIIEISLLLVVQGSEEGLLP